MALDVALGGQHKHGRRSTRLHNNRLTCRLVNQFEHVCVEECLQPTASGDSCEESQRLSFGGSAPRRPQQGKPNHDRIRTQTDHLTRMAT